MSKLDKLKKDLLKSEVEPLFDYKRFENSLNKILSKVNMSKDESAVLLKDVVKAVKDIKLSLPDVLEVEVKNQQKIPKEVNIKNFPKETSVNNFPKEVNLAKPDWWKELDAKDIADPIEKAVFGAATEIIKRTGRVMIENRLPKEAIPVVLTDRDLKSFYNAVFGAVSSGSTPAFKDSSGNSQRGLVDADGHLQVDVLTGGGGGTQYTEGDTDATFTGTIAMAEGPSNTATPLQVDASKHLQVDIAADSVGIGGGTEYTEGDTDATIVGKAILWEDAADTLATVSASKPLPVDVKSSALPSGAATSANQTTIIGHVDGIEGLLTTIDTDTSTIAADTTSIDGKITACDTGAVTISGALPAGSNNIGDVDVATVPAPLNVVGGGTEASALRVTIASDSTGVLTIDDGGSSITVDGTVTIDDGGGSITVDGSVTVSDGGGSLTVDNAGLTELAAAINASSQMDVNIAVDNAGLATAANQLPDGHNVTVDNGAGAAAVNIQDGGNTITVDGTVTANLSATDNTVLDNIALYTAGSETALEKIDGAVVGPGEPTIDSYTQVSINLDAGANQVLVSSAANKQIWVYGFGFTVSAAGTVSFQDEDDTPITGIMDFAANSGMSQGPSGNFSMPIWKLDTNKDLEVDIVDAALDGWISYAIVSV